MQITFINLNDESNLVFICIFLTLCLNDFSFPLLRSRFYYSVSTIGNIAQAITTTEYFHFILHAVFLIFVHKTVIAVVPFNISLFCSLNLRFCFVLPFCKQIFVTGINFVIVLPDISSNQNRIAPFLSEICITFKFAHANYHISLFFSTVYRPKRFSLHF